MDYPFQKRLPATSGPKPKSFEYGERFEKFVRNVIFSNRFYGIIHKTHSYEQNQVDFVENSKDPDFLLQIHRQSDQFYVECKFRDFTENYSQMQRLLEKHGFNPRVPLPKENYLALEQEFRRFAQIDIYKREQFLRHRSLDRKKPVFLALGLYNAPNKDLAVFVFPIRAMITHFTRLESVERFVVPNNYPVFPDLLIDLVDSPREGFCIRCRSPIILDIEQPLCEDCWPSWYKTMNFKATENHCHTCGKDLAVSVARPDCPICYAKGDADLHFA